MTHNFKLRSVASLVVMASHGLAVVLLFGGCGGSQNEKITAEKSGLRPADDDEESSSSSAEKGNPQGQPDLGDSVDTVTGGNVSARELDPIPAYKDPFIRESSDDEEDDFRNDPFRVPEDATPEELMAYIKKLDLRRPVGATPDLQLLDVINSMKARQQAAEQILASENLDEGLRYDAIAAKLGTLRFLARVGGPDDTKALRDFADGLKTDKDPRVVMLNRMASLDLMLEGLQQGRLTDPAPVLAEVKAMVAEENVDMQVLLLAHHAAGVFQSIRAFDEAVEALTVAGNRFKTSEDSELAEYAARLLDEARIVALQQELFGVIRGDESAKERLYEKVDQMLADKNPPGMAMDMLLGVERQLEYTGNMDMARDITDKIADAFATHEDQELAAEAARAVQTTMKRLSLVGQPFVIEGAALNGKPFDWDAYRGKVVLVDFWAEWCGICMEEIPYIREVYRRYQDKGFAVVGVNLDDTREVAQRAVASVSMPWTTVVPKDGNLQGVATDPNAVRYGVAALPFTVLVDKDGKAVALHVRGRMLEEKLKEMLGPPTDVSVDDLPAGTQDNVPHIRPLDLPEGDRPDAPPAKSDPAPPEGEGGTDANATPPPATDARRESPGRVYLCGLFDVAQEDATAVPDETNEDDEAANGDVDESGAEPSPEAVNPYSPDEGLTSFELVDFLFEMKEKPRVIQSRPGFTDAVVEAADRLLASDASDKFKETAALTKLEYLHKDARLGNEQADKALLEFVEQLKESERERIAAEVKFLLLERRAMDVDELEKEQVIELLTKLEEFFTDRQLITKHLRIASSTVAAINRLESDDLREEYFAKFGKLFSDSDDRQLAAYGKKLAKKPGESAPDVVGREVALAGATVDGIAFDWSAYQGKVVLLQFWATWCPACLREMPQVAKFYDEHHDKGVDVVGVNMDKDLAKLADYLEKHDTPWTHLAGEHCQEIAREYGVRAFPTLMLVDRDGKVAAVGHRVADLTDALEKLLGK